MIDDATRAQIAAADPRFSTWLSANAGSGKTRVLTDRVARLLLNGTEPQSILCLTYTKAAAGEMQNRLFRRLGKWAMLEDDALVEELRGLGEAPPEDLARARTLFARAVEAPGGLKIQTIHSFCSSVLRQFPLEAGVSPQFRELDETGQKALIEDVIDRLAREKDSSLLLVTRIVSDETLTDLASSVARSRSRFSGGTTEDAIFRKFGVQKDLSLDDILHAALSIDDVAFLKRCAATLVGSDGVRDQELAQQLAFLPEAPNNEALLVLERCLLTGGSAKEPFTAKIGSLPSKSMREGSFQVHLDRFNAVMKAVERARDQRVSHEAAAKTTALHDFANAFLPVYAEAKQTAGVLDFDDLIQKVGVLLTDRSLEWVLYRLDGGIEHVLVDEAQDTSPSQWNVIEALAREIVSGEGARPNRTVFVVGDKKQSIYSFQGADAKAFDQVHANFKTFLANHTPLQSRELHFSFRSSSAILAAVDTVFARDAQMGLGQEIQHRAFHEKLPGRMDIWPLVPAPEAEETPEWYDPIDRTAANDPKVILANKIAGNIREMIGTETISGENGQPRRVRAGDFLVLVQGRGALFDHIIRACKALDLPIAGADRLKIGGELAVRDLLALMSFLALQEDDLSLAAALRSPLFGWSEKMLYDLAQGRKQPYLWAELRDRKAEFVETFQMLNDLLTQVDYLRPYELLEMILNKYEGRTKLLARLGPEAEDGIDELLNQALSYERDAVPSLTDFLTRAHAEDVEIKRQSDGSGNLIRVMTVHGAKGLESPIVILPDTTRSPKPQRNPILLDEDIPVWRMPKDNCPEAIIPAREAAERADQEERRRLLYVAMTRAETWLIACGTENRRNAKSDWYVDIQGGLREMSFETINTPTGQGWRVSHGDWPVSAPDEKAKETPARSEIPDFLRLPARASTQQVRALSPSDLGGEKAVAGSAREEEAALRHGRQIHRLLEFLPRAALTREAATRILAGGPDPVEAAEIDTLLAEAVGVLRAHPELFRNKTLAEVDVAAFLPVLGRRISGTIDRLDVDSDHIVSVDFKTNPIVPVRPEDVPEGILRQMGAYLSVLELIYPERDITLRIIWTATATAMDLPHAIVREALSRTTIS